MAKSRTKNPSVKSSSVKIERLSPHIGAEIFGVDLGQPLARTDVKKIKAAFVEHEVLVFRNQKLTQAQYIEFTAQFGKLTIHPFATALPDHPELIVLDNDKNNPPLSTDQWHSDEMFRTEPPWATALRATIVPKIGGDTCFASMTSAYDGLHPSVQKFYSGLEAVNDFKVFRVLYSGTREGRERLVELEEKYPNVTHPVVRVHPISKKRAIYVSPQTTKYISNVRDFESEHILHMLYQLPEIPEYQLRVQWEPNMIVLWDNISTQHYAPRDFLPHRRQMERLTIKGGQPYGIGGNKRRVSVKMNVRGTDDDSYTGHHRKGLTRPADVTLKSC